MEFKTTRVGSAGTRAPSIEAIEHAKELVKRNPEAAVYLMSSFVEKMKKLGTIMVNSSKNIEDQLEKYCTLISQQYQSSRDDPWSGNYQEPSFKNLQNAHASTAANTLVKEAEGPIRIDFAISDAAHLLRGFSANGRAFDNNSAKLEQVDSLLNGFFAEKGFVSYDSTIYQATSDGKIDRGKDGNPIKADPEQIKALLANLFKPYLQEKGIQATVVSHNYPEKPAAPQEEIRQQSTPST